jgi:peptide/nickel transport system substrate-binding protein
VRGAAATWAALESGKVQVAEVPTAPSDAVEAALAGLDSATTLSPVVWQLCFNLTDAVLAQPEIRQAIADGTDRTQLVADSVGLDDPGIPVADNRIFLQDAPGYDSHAGQYETVDIDAGQDLLEGAGYLLGSDGYFSLRGKPLIVTLTYPTGNAMAASAAQLFAAEMKDLGIRVRFVATSLGALVGQALPAGDYQLALAPFVGSPYQSWTQPLYNQVVAGATGPGRGAGLAPSTSAVGPLGAPAVAGSSGSGGSADAGLAAVPAGATSPAGPTTVGSDVTELSDPAITTLYQEAAAQLDPPTARGLYNEIDTLLWQDLPTLPLFQMPVTLVTAHDLVNVSESPTPAGVMWNAADWAIALNLPAVTPPAS